MSGRYGAVLRVAALAALVGAGTAMAAPKKAEPAWKFRVDPRLTMNAARVDASTSGPAEAMIIEVTDLATSPAKRILSGQNYAARQFEIPMPVVQSDTFAEVTATTNPAEKEPLLRWRTVLRQRGRALISYRGQRELLPPTDFNAYWKRARKQLAAVPMVPVVTRVTAKDTSTGLLHRVDLPTVEETTISCWYYVPRAAFGPDGKVVRKFPAVQVAPGYGAEEPPIDRTKDGIITLSVNPRNHGPSRDFWKSPVEHLGYNIDNPEKYYYKLAVLDVLRAAEFLFSRPEVDVKRVAAEGGSQGGYFAVAAAAFEPRFRCIVSNVTAFSAYPEGMRLNLIGFATSFRRMIEDAPTKAKREAIEKSLAYTDGANLARRVTCPVQINMGDKDPVCHYMCGVVVHNRLPDSTVREINVFPDCKHEVPQKMREANQRWYKEHLLK